MPKVNAWETASFDLEGLNSKGKAVFDSSMDTYVLVQNSDLYIKLPNFFNHIANGRIEAYFTINGEKVQTTNSEGHYWHLLNKEEIGKEIRFEVKRTKDGATLPAATYDVKTNSHPIVGTASVTVNKPDSKGIIKITGETEKAGLKFTDMYVDDNFLASFYDYSIDYKLDTKQFALGVHKLTIKLSDGKVININFPTNIVEAPKNNVSQVKTYNNFLIYNVDYSVDSEYDGVYVQLKKGNGKWGSYYGPFKSWQKEKIKGLSQNTTYQIRTVYVKGAGTKKQYMGPYSKVLTVKTGKKAKLSVKSMKISNVKQKKKYIAGRTWWDAGGVKHSVKGHYAYTTTYKITVNLKKKPGTKGICIGDHKLKGNKKKYTLKITSSGKLKGKKVTVSVMSYNNDKYGAYSAIYTKKLKIK